jgi:hypothetical protein
MGSDDAGRIASGEEHLGLDSLAGPPPAGEGKIEIPGAVGALDLSGAAADRVHLCGIERFHGERVPFTMLHPSPRFNDSAPTVNLGFAHSWEATVLERPPLIAPTRHFVYPAEVEEVERGALELAVRPRTEQRREFLATFALGFADPAVPTGVWACPHPDWLCAVAGGYAYLVNTAQPKEWAQVEYRPVLAVTSIVSPELLLFSGHQSMIAYGPAGKVWETGRLSWEGVRILSVGDQSLTGLGWDLMTDREFEFEVDLRTGEHLRLG